jgi:Predicted amidophosphoribosyltransferases
VADTKLKNTEKLLQIFFPKTCPICEEILEKHREICRKCEKNLRYIREPKCKKCGKPFELEESGSELREYCTDCIKRTHHYESGMAVFQYSDELRESIYRFKYYNQRTYAKFYGRAMACYKRQIKDLGIQILIPVPISRKRKITRGYNQAELMAQALGRELNLPVDSGYLLREKNTLPQKELNEKERRNNLKNAFKISENVIKYKKVLLVDDIYTTGSTIDACALVLKQAGAEKVYFISLCIGVV